MWSLKPREMGRFSRGQCGKALLVSIIILTATYRLFPEKACIVGEKGIFPSVLGKCTETRHIYYIKIHKTGSGTFSNVLFRFGLVRNLTFALPKEGYMFPKAPIQANDIHSFNRNRKYDILFHHSVFNPALKKQIFPPDTLVIASLRDPFSLFLSSYFFFHYKNDFRKVINLTGNVVEEVSSFIDHLYNQSSHNQNGTFYFNRLSFSLGIPLSKSRDVSYLEHHLNTVLAPHVDIVTLQEYFDESLVLIKRKLCWRTEDIIYIAQHVRKDRNSFLSIYNFSETVRAKHKALAPAEYMIYDHFKPVFWRQVNDQRSDFYREVRHFKDILQAVQKFCLPPPNATIAMTIPESPWNSQFRVDGGSCDDLHRNDVRAIKIILDRDAAMSKH